VADELGVELERMEAAVRPLSALLDELRATSPSAPAHHSLLSRVDAASQKAKWALEPLYERLLSRLNAADHNGVRLILDMRRDLLAHLKSFPPHLDDGR